MKKNNIINYAAGLFCIAAVTGLALGVLSIYAYRQQIQACDRGAQVNQKMAELLFVNGLVQQLNDNHVDKVKMRLSDEVAERLAALDSVQGNADEPTQVMAKILLKQIAHDQKLHPDYYPTIAQTSTSAGTKVAQISDHQ
jgi:hypothetical protein